MIDRSIPYYNLILKCTKICTTPVSLPEGYSFKMYDVGDEKYWAKLEYEIGDFSSVEESEMYFKTNYCNQIDELKKPFNCKTKQIHSIQKKFTKEINIKRNEYYFLVNITNNLFQ